MELNSTLFTEMSKPLLNNSTSTLNTSYIEFNQKSPYGVGFLENSKSAKSESIIQILRDIQLQNEKIEEQNQLIWTQNSQILATVNEISGILNGCEIKS